MSKAQRGLAKKSVANGKPLVVKKKTVKPNPPTNGNGRAKPAVAVSRRTPPKVEPRDSSKARQVQSKPAPVQKAHSREYANAVHAYEAGLRLMHAEDYGRAIKAFRELIAEHANEPEILERARVLMQASEKKLHEKEKTILRSAEDHYNMGIAELNARQLDAAAQRLQHALKLAPKGDHILYAMAAVNALKGNRDQALTFLKQAIHYRPENRFLASRDNDFDQLADDPDFKHLTASSEK